MRKYLLESVVLINGACVMIFEITGARLLGPYLGTTLFVWTSLIGVILGSLSLGYWLGGRAADRNANFPFLAKVILAAGIYVIIVGSINTSVLQWLQSAVKDIRLGAVLASIMLFAAPSILMGMVTPYAIRLKIKTVNTSGATVGALFAISTIGSILGTFLTGFFLLPWLGSIKVTWIIAFLLLSCALLVHPIKKKGGQALLFLIAISFLIAAWRSSDRAYVDIDTPYSRVMVFPTINKKGDSLSIMRIDNHIGSAKYLNSDNLVYDYLKFFYLSTHFKPAIKKALMLGGAGYSFPMDFIKKHPKSNMDVVEIDPALTTLAKQHFGLSASSQLSIFHQDARTFLNQSKTKYDVVFVDVFKALYSIPFQLTTKEAVSRMHEALNDDGVAVVNILSTLQGAGAEFLKAEVATFKTIFSEILLFPVDSPDHPEQVQNVILVALKSKWNEPLVSKDSTLNAYLEHHWQPIWTSQGQVLTDAHAPVEYLINKAL